MSWTGTLDFHKREMPGMPSKGANILVRYADGKPDQTFTVEDVHDHGDGTVTLDVRIPEQL